jgi:hypothetical protein
MTTGLPGQGAPMALAIDKIYGELCASIRDTDSISFRLLGLVPLVSGTALLTLVLQKERLPPAFVMLLALFAAFVTLGLFRWELRNIQTCSRLIKYTHALEEGHFATDAVPRRLFPRPRAPQGVGKAEAEKLIYGVTIVTWLGLPVAVGAFTLNQAAARGYLVLAAVVILATMFSLLADPHAPAPIECTSEPPNNELQRTRPAQAMEPRR